MASSLFDIAARVIVDTSQGVKSLSDLHTKLGQTEGAAGVASGGIAGFIQAALPMVSVTAVAGGLAAGLGFVVDAASESEQVMSRTNSVLASTQGISGMTAGSVERLANQMLSLTGIDDEATQAAENVLLTYTNISGAAFPAATQATADLATALADGAVPSMSQMTSAADILGKAMNQPDQAARALRSAHIFLTDSQNASIKAFMAVGDIAGAQGVIMDAVKQRYEGAAVAAGSTFAGSMQKLQNQFMNVAESLGAILLPALSGMLNAITPIVSWLANMVTALTSNSTAMEIFKGVLIVLGAVLLAAIIPALGILLPMLGGVAAAAWAAIAPFLIAAAPFLAVGAAIGIVVVAFKLLYEHFAPFRALVDGIVNAIRTGLLVAFATLQPYINQARAAIAAFATEIGSRAQPIVSALFAFIKAALPVLGAVWGAHWNTIVSVLRAAWSVIQGVVQIAVSIITGVISIGMNLIRGNWSGAWNAVVSMMRGIAGGIQGIVSGLMGAVVSIIRGYIGAAQSAMAAVGNGIVGAISGLGGRLASAVHGAINAMISAIRGMIGAVAGAFGSLFSGIKLPHFQTGGITPGGPIVVGERGPETLVPPAGWRVVPGVDRSNMIGGGMVTSRGGGGAGGATIIQLLIDDGGLRVLGQALLPYQVDQIRRVTGIRGA